MEGHRKILGNEPLFSAGSHAALNLSSVRGFPLEEASRGCSADVVFLRGGSERLILGRYSEMAGIQPGLVLSASSPRSSPAETIEGAGIVPELRHVPRIEGIGGFQNVNYMSGKYRLIYRARSTIQLFKNLVRPLR